MASLRLLLLSLMILSSGQLIAAEWMPLAEDSIHDPDNPALSVLQEPGDALSQLPVDTGNIGNKVRWVQALEEGYINPRTNIYPDTKIEVLDLDILMKNTGSAGYVLFPHDKHTAWLDCSNCHDKIFAAKAGETPMSMLMILSGEYCGRCHGAVAFPLTACKRCHSVPQEGTEQGAVK
jgi:c(7)-type cytochrome triheme protein